MLPVGTSLPVTLLAARVMEPFAEIGPPMVSRSALEEEPPAPAVSDTLPVALIPPVPMVSGLWAVMLTLPVASASLAAMVLLLPSPVVTAPVLSMVMVPAVLESAPMLRVPVLVRSMVPPPVAEKLETWLAPLSVTPPALATVSPAAMMGPLWVIPPAVVVKVTSPPAVMPSTMEVTFVMG